MVYDVYGLRLGKWKDGKEPVSKQQIQRGNRTDKPISRDQIIRGKRRQEKLIFSYSDDSVKDWQTHRLMLNMLHVMTIHTYCSIISTGFSLYNPTPNNH